MRVPHAADYENAGVIHPLLRLHADDYADDSVFEPPAAKVSRMKSPQIMISMTQEAETEMEISKRWPAHTTCGVLLFMTFWAKINFDLCNVIQVRINATCYSCMLA